MSAPVHTIQMRCVIANRLLVAIGPEARTVLQVEALRDCTLCHIKVEYPGNPPGFWARAWVEQQLCRTEGAAFGVADGDALLCGREDLPVIEPGRTLLHNYNAHPHDFWAGEYDISVPKGCLVGVAVRASMHAGCRVTIGAR